VRLHQWPHDGTLEYLIGKLDMLRSNAPGATRAGHHRQKIGLDVGVQPSEALSGESTPPAEGLR
jgi:hypothetical protein